MILNFELNHVLKVTHFLISHKELKTQFFFFFWSTKSMYEFVMFKILSFKEKGGKKEKVCP